MLPEERKQADDPIAAAIDVINQLLALCTEHGLKREAYSIVIGRELASPPKRRRGAPLVKDYKYRRELAALLEIEALGPEGRKGAKARLARALAMEEVGKRNRFAWRSAAWRSEAGRSGVEKRTLSRQNDLSKLSPLEVVEAAYYVRCIRKGESTEKAKKRLDAVMAGDTSAEREVFEIIRDLVRTDLTRIPPE